jgi:hypothetical protein
MQWSTYVLPESYSIASDQTGQRDETTLHQLSICVAKGETNIQVHLIWFKIVKERNDIDRKSSASQQLVYLMIHDISSPVERSFTNWPIVWQTPVRSQTANQRACCAEKWSLQIESVRQTLLLLHVTFLTAYAWSTVVRDIWRRRTFCIKDTEPCGEAHL